ncbi:MAG: 4'-phosphopantetheinyl transferase superfamily protein [Bacteroidota bacterium]
MPLVFESSFDNDSSILGIWKIDERKEELLEQLMMKPIELQMLNSFQNDTRKIQWLSVRTLIRALLQNPTIPLEIKYDENTKPSLVKSNYHVSISHSKDKAAVLLSKSKLIGIDIEFINPKIEKVIHKFLSLDEINSASENNNILYYHICWCAKEALYKLNGRKGINFIDDIKIKPFICQHSGEFQASIRFDEKIHDFTMNYLKINDYMLVYVIG